VNFSEREDQIILTGWSRGAFTVRALALFIEDVGLLTRPGLVHLGELYEEWKRSLKPQGDEKSWNMYLDKLYDEGLRRKHVKIKACAVWDTVASLNPGSKTFKKMRERTENPQNIENGFHALALDEARLPFAPTLWKPSRYLKQCWFSGRHSDCGSGGERPLEGYISLAWMISQLHNFVSFDILAVSKLKIERADDEGWMGKLFSLFWCIANKFCSYSRQEEEKDEIHVTVTVPEAKKAKQTGGNEFEKARLHQWKDQWSGDTDGLTTQVDRLVNG
jgi:hypothetical protein